MIGGVKTLLPTPGVPRVPKQKGGGQLWFQLYTAGEGGREEVGEENGTIYQSEYIIVISRNL